MSETGYKPEYEYAWDDFRSDFYAWACAANAAPNTDYQPATYFATKYPDRKESDYKMRRFGAALLYLQRHVGSEMFDEFLVKGDKRGLISEPLVAGLWRYFGGVPEAHLKSDPSESVIMRLAKGEL